MEAWRWRYLLSCRSSGEVAACGAPSPFASKLNSAHACPLAPQRLPCRSGPPNLRCSVRLAKSRTRFSRRSAPFALAANMVTASALVQEPAPAAALKRLSGTPAAAGAGPPPEQPLLVHGSEEWRRHLPVTDIHPHDEGTKDAWIPRCAWRGRLQRRRHWERCRRTAARGYHSYACLAFLHQNRVVVHAPSSWPLGRGAHPSARSSSTHPPK